MKLLLFTRFHPSIGGLETVMEILAEQWAAAGYEIQVATDIPGNAAASTRRFSFPIHYQPSTGRLLGLVKWSDVYIQGCVGLKMLWPLLIHRRKYVATHHTWYRHGTGRRGWQNRLKLAVSRWAINIAPSQAIADDLETGCVVIPNPYREDTFHLRTEEIRSQTLLFVGRLVTDKGVDLLLEALVILKERGLHPDLTVAGEGPELPTLQDFSTRHDLGGQVVFAGAQSAEQVAIQMSRHRILVIPSRWSEPFGVVAVEGIACGCLVLGSEQGGLTDAIGPCGRTFPNDDARALARQLQELLHAPPPGPLEAGVRDAHLARHRPAAVAQRYLKVIRSEVNA